MFKTTKAWPCLFLLSLLMHHSSVSYAQVLDDDTDSTFTTTTWVVIGIVGLGIGIGSGLAIFSSVGIGVKKMDKKDKAMLLDQYLEHNPGQMLEAASWGSSPMAREVAKVCGAQDAQQERSVSSRLRLHRATLVSLLDQPSDQARGQQLWQLWCSPLELGANQR